MILGSGTVFPQCHQHLVNPLPLSPAQTGYLHALPDIGILNSTFHSGNSRVTDFTITTENLANDLGMSKSTIYYQLQFAKKYPEFSTAVENLPWRQARQLLSAKTNKGKSKRSIPLLPDGKFDVIWYLLRLRERHFWTTKLANFERILT